MWFWRGESTCRTARFALLLNRAAILAETAMGFIVVPAVQRNRPPFFRQLLHRAIELISEKMLHCNNFG